MPSGMYQTSVRTDSRFGNRETRKAPATIRWMFRNWRKLFAMSELGGIEGPFDAGCSKLPKTPMRSDKSTAYGADAWVASVRSTAGGRSEAQTWLKRYGSLATPNNIMMFQ